jgi:WD40 repeat protein
VADQLWVSQNTHQGRYDITTGALVPGISIDQEGKFPAPFDDSAHDRVFLMWDHQVKGFDQAGQYIGPTIAPPSIVEDNFINVWSTPDGKAIVVSSSADGTHLYDAATGARLNASGAPLVRSVVGRNGIAIGSTLDGGLYVFDPYTLELQDELPGTHGYAEELYLSDDESILVVGNESDGIRLYDVAGRTQIGDAIPYFEGSIGLASLRPDGMELAIAAGDLGVVIWDLDPAHWLDAACSLAGRNLTHTEWDLYIGDLAEYHESCVGGRANRID